MKRRNFLARLAALPALLLGGAAVAADRSTGAVMHFAGRDWTQTRTLALHGYTPEQGLAVAERQHRELLASGVMPSEAFVCVRDVNDEWGHTIYWDGSVVARSSWQDRDEDRSRLDPRSEPNVTAWRTGIGPGGRAVNVPPRPVDGGRVTQNAIEARPLGCQGGAAELPRNSAAAPPPFFHRPRNDSAAGSPGRAGVRGSAGTAPLL